jgi:hypothetical protein
MSVLMFFHQGRIARIIAQLRYEERIPHTPSIIFRDQLADALEEQALLLRRCLEGHSHLRQALAEQKKVRGWIIIIRIIIRIMDGL